MAATTSINSVVLVGNLVRDPEMKDVGSSKLMNFTLAVNENMKKGDSYESYPNYVDCQLWGKRAEVLSVYMKKGSQVVVNGAIHQDRWEKDGVKNSRIIIKVSDINLVGGKSGSSEKTVKSAAPEVEGDFPEDIPF